MNASRFWLALNGLAHDRTPTLGKIWLDWAAAHGYCELTAALRDPRQAMLSIVRAGRDMRFDAARLFLLPPRDIRRVDGRLWHIAPDGGALGALDECGGLATLLKDAAALPLDDPAATMAMQTYAAKDPFVSDAEGARRLAVPSARWYEAQGYGAAVEEAKALCGEAMCPIGDCNTGTLSFLVALRGMTRAMYDLLDEPALAHACMEKGVALCAERARFFLSHGVKALRYNDSAANMTVLSPSLWREFVAPHLRDFTAEVRSIDPQARVYCHMCGDTLPVLRDIRKAGIDCIGPLDPLSGHTVADFRKAAGEDATLYGGVNTLTLLNGTPQQAREESRRCIEQGGERFLLGSGCAVARATPKENLLAMSEAAEETENEAPRKG